MTRSIVSFLLCWLGGMTGFQAPLLFAQEANPASDTGTSAIKIVVIAGEGGVNSLKAKSAVQPMVEVRDANGQPVPGAVVTFDAPESGPSVVFSNGSRSQSLVSEIDGRAAVSGMQPVGLGQFRLTVTAVYDQHFATAIIDQANLSRSGAASLRASQNVSGSGTAGETGSKTGMSTRAKVGIIGGIAIAAAVAFAVALTRGGSSGSTVSGTGTPTVGPPH